MSAPDEHSRFALGESVLIQKLGAQTVLMHVKNGEYFELNKSGALALDALLLSDLFAAVASLTSTFEVEEARARKDVELLVQELSTRGLLQAR